tara:strand:+ start:1427 stop:1558 length:132 start_codon:yes stop_codon:yes gene_type:complete
LFGKIYFSSGKQKNNIYIDKPILDAEEYSCINLNILMYPGEQR